MFCSAHVRILSGLHPLIYRKRCQIFLRSFSKRLQLANDITGNSCSFVSSSGGTLSLLDESIMSMITMERSAIATLRNCLKLDSRSGIVNALLVFELSRNTVYCDGSGNVDNEIQSCLASIEDHFESLTLRERFFGAAAVAWKRGNYRHAGMLLESSVLSGDGDALAVRLAQDCYLAAGDRENVLGCVTRCLQLSDQKHLLHGHLLGMLSAGYLENGRYLDAEETARRAVVRTNARDIVALNSLLNVLLLSGRSSEVLAVLDEHLDKHAESGHQSLLFSKGCALAQRGNYRGALRVYDTMIESIENDSKIYFASQLLHASFLIWQVALHSMDQNIISRWPKLAKHWKFAESRINENDVLPLVHLCKIMAFSGTIFYQPLSNRSACSSSSITSGNKNKSHIQLPEGGRIEVNSEEAKHPQDTDLLSWFWSPVYNANIIPSTAGDIFEDDVLTEQDFEHYTSCVQTKEFSTTLFKGTIADRYPQLEKMAPLFKGCSISPEMNAYFLKNPDKTERDWAMRTCGASLLDAIKCFHQPGLDSIKQSAALLSLVNSTTYRIGCSRVQCDIFSQALIESLLRSEQWLEARLLLSERTSLSPNDAQAWRRQASVFGRLGLKSMAEDAHYTAWQLGIGQGGFGGPT